MSTVSNSRDLALVLGDSHVYWPGRFVANSMVRFGSGHDFTGDNCRIRFNGFRGGSADSLERVTSLLAAGIPRVIILAIGGNDIDSATDHPLLVGMRVFELAKSLVSRGVERVMIWRSNQPSVFINQCYPVYSVPSLFDVRRAARVVIRSSSLFTICVIC